MLFRNYILDIDSGPGYISARLFREKSSRNFDQLQVQVRFCSKYFENFEWKLKSWVFLIDQSLSITHILILALED